jgi:ribosomal protein S27AE
MQTTSNLPMVENPDARRCPDCGSGSSIYSVRRDGGSRLYCGMCHKAQWLDPEWPERMRKLREGR